MLFTSFIAIALVLLTYIIWYRYRNIDCDLATYRCKVQKSYFANKNIWITGCSSGIGKALTYYLSDPSFNVKTLIISARSKQNLLQIQSEINQQINKNIQIIVSDFDLNEINVEYYNEKYNEMMGQMGEESMIDILINNAGFSMNTFASDMNIKNDISMFKVNLISPIILLKLVLSKMIEMRCGDIVCVSSIHARIKPCCRTTYSSTKAGILAFHESLLDEVKDYNINISVILPGPTATNVNMLDKNIGNKFGNTMFEQQENESENEKENENKDDWISTGMDANRCAELICVAMSNAIFESWPCIKPILYSMYMAYYLPSIYHWWYKPWTLSPKLKQNAGYN